MALHSLYLFAARIAALAKDWEPEELEKLERCREFCRNLCLKAGLAHDTQCLCDLWVALTSAKVKLTSEMEGHDIDENSMGVMRCRSISWNFIQKMNVYERKFFKEDLQALQGMLVKFADLEPGLIGRVEDCCDKVSATI
jgi:hypothetical protein